MIFVGLILRGRRANLSCTQWKALLSYFKTNLYCHYCYLYDFYKSPFKLSDSDPKPGPRRFPGPWCSLHPLSPSRGREEASSLPARLSTRADCPQCAPHASRHVKCARGLRQCRQPTRDSSKQGEVSFRLNIHSGPAATLLRFAHC